MNLHNRMRWPVLLAAVAILALLAAACSSSGGTAATDTSGDTEGQVESTEPEEGADEEAADEAAEEDDSQDVVTEVVEQSGAAQGSVTAGVSVTSDEDVTTPRDMSKFGGEYHGVATSDGVSFHPYLTTDTTSGGMQNLVYTGGLLRLDENTLEYIPNMAESYTISEDGLTFTFHLREGMLWSDGEPITAHDFKWTYDQVTNPDNGYPYLSQLDFITSYEALDDYTLEIKIDEVYAPALGQMSGLITPLPQHVWEDLDWDDPESNPEINSPSVVSGPYKLVEWERDQFQIYEANPDYWYKGSPLRERIVTEIVPDQDIAYERLKSGEADTSGITPENLDEARSLDHITVYEWWPAAASWSYIGLNMREGFPTHDVNVRHAINYAIDKELITDEVMLGQAKRLCSVYPETSWVYNPDVECYAYDPDMAIAKFEEAGYTYDADSNQMLDENGDQVTLRMLYVTPSQTQELIAVTVQDYLAEIGVNVEGVALEWASFLDATDAEDPDWDLFLGGWRATIEPHIMYTIWSEDSIPDLNSVAYINKDVEQLFEEGGSTYDTDVRIEKYQEVQRIISEEAPYVFLFYSKSWAGLNNRVQGIDPKPLGISWNSEDWYIQEEVVE